MNWSFVADAAVVIDAVNFADDVAIVIVWTVVVNFVVLSLYLIILMLLCLLQLTLLLL